MNKLREKINTIPKAYFSFNDLKKLINLDQASLKVSLNRAIKNDDLIRLQKGIYAKNLADISWRNLAVNIYSPSYISFQSALNYYNILSQQAHSLTLATTKRSKTINIYDNLLVYRHLKKDLFFAYFKENDYIIAEAEKAFLDLAYLSLNGYANLDISEMNLELLDKKKLFYYEKKFKNKKLSNLIKRIFID